MEMQHLSGIQVRAAPLKQLTPPRVELKPAVLAAELHTSPNLVEQLDCPTLDT